MNRVINVVILGAAECGSTLAKETARYLSCLKVNEVDYRLIIADKACVTPEDVLRGVYLTQDAGWSKAAVLAQVIISNLNRHSPDGSNVLDLSKRVHAFGIDASDVESLTKVCRYQCSGNYMTIVCDCTGNEKVHAAVGQVLNNGNCNMCAVSLSEDGVHVAASFVSTVLKPLQKFSKGCYTRTEKLQAVYFMLAKIVRAFSEKQFDMDSVRLNVTEPNIEINRKPSLIVCVGAGGTGGDFVKECMPFIALKDISFLLIDGDKVEEKNRSRQPYTDKDIMQNKADTLCRSFVEEYPSLQGRVHSWPQYLDTVEDLENAIASVTKLKEDELILLVGAVDNHRARQVLHQYYQKRQNIIYMDAGNEFDYGEVVTGVRMGSESLAKERCQYFTDVLTDNSPAASELSCGVVNVSAPQHQVTNLMAAELLFHNLEQLLNHGKVSGGITYFDTFSCTRKHCFS